MQQSKDVKLTDEVKLTDAELARFEPHHRSNAFWVGYGDYGSGKWWKVDRGYIGRDRLAWERGIELAHLRQSAMEKVESEPNIRSDAAGYSLM